MTKQEINDQLELLRLKELFMSDIDIRSKMAVLICNNREENPPFKEFCELTHCEPHIARMSFPKISRQLLIIFLSYWTLVLTLFTLFLKKFTIIQNSQTFSI